MRSLRCEASATTEDRSGGLKITDTKTDSLSLLSYPGGGRSRNTPRATAPSQSGIMQLLYSLTQRWLISSVFRVGRPAYPSVLDCFSESARPSDRITSEKKRKCPFNFDVQPSTRIYRPNQAHYPTQWSAVTQRDAGQTGRERERTAIAVVHRRGHCLSPRFTSVFGVPKLRVTTTPVRRGCDQAPVQPNRIDYARTPPSSQCPAPCVPSII